EFDNDPEVRNCLLSAAEIAIKERIWVTHNEDWLRAQQAKILKQQLEEAEGGPPKKRSYKKKNHGRMGDGTVLEGGTPVA
ncbi:transcription factor TFIIIB subunit brf1, partial [Cryomyces antarcticus]